VGPFVHVGAGAGFGFSPGDMQEPPWYVAPDGSVWFGPDDYGHRGFSRDYDRQVQSAGAGLAIPALAMRLGVGYAFLPELSAELNCRFSIPVGEDFPWLVEARAAWWFEPARDHLLSIFAGVGGGVTMHMIPEVTFTQRMGDPATKTYEPFYKLTGYGTASLGTQYRYRIARWFAVGAELAVNAAYPAFSMNIDLLGDLAFTIPL
jgi:hypothetical protein